MRPQGGALIQLDKCLYKKRYWAELARILSPTLTPSLSLLSPPPSLYLSMSLSLSLCLSPFLSLSPSSLSLSHTFSLLSPTMWGIREVTTAHKPREETQNETYLAGTLILDFQTPELLEINFCYLSHPVCGVLLWQP